MFAAQDVPPKTHCTWKLLKDVEVSRFETKLDPQIVLGFFASGFRAIFRLKIDDLALCPEIGPIFSNLRKLTARREWNAFF